MKLPNQNAPINRGVSNVQAGSGIEASSCSIWKKIGCGAALAACGASCALGPEVCIPCLAGVGASDCLDCF